VLAVPGLPDFKELKRIAFRVETSGRVKELRGFIKGHSVPDHDSATARKFVARIAEADIKSDLDETYQAIRDGFGFKRRQLESSVEDGIGVIHTPRFDYSASVHLDPEKSTSVIWRREVSAFRDPAMVRAPEFLAAFGNLFNVLVFEFARPISLEEFIDRIEDESEHRPGVKVRCSSDASTCEITLAGFRGAIRIDRTHLAIEGRQSPTAASLLDQFLAFLERFTRAKNLPAIR
jgi:hypothetical protein